LGYSDQFNYESLKSPNEVENISKNEIVDDENIKELTYSSDLQNKR